MHENDNTQASISTRGELLCVVLLFLRFRRLRLVFLVLVVPTEVTVPLVIVEAAVISLATLLGV